MTDFEKDMIPVVTITFVRPGQRVLIRIVDECKMDGDSHAPKKENIEKEI